MPSLLSTYTKEELLKKLKKQKTMFIIQGFLIFLMIIFSVFSTVENGISFQTFLPFRLPSSQNNEKGHHELCTTKINLPVLHTKKT